MKDVDAKELAQQWANLPALDSACKSAGATVGALRELAAEDPALAATGLALVADLRRLRGPDRGLEMGKGDRKALELYVEAYCLGRTTQPERTNYALARIALKAADVALALGLRDEARRAYRWATESREAFPKLVGHEGLAAMHARDGDFEAAIAELSHVPTAELTSLNFLPSMLFAKGQYREAAQVWEQDLAEYLQGRALALAGWAWHRAGEDGRALRVLARAAQVRRLYGGEDLVLHAIARVQGLSPEPMADFDPEWGEVPRPLDEAPTTGVFTAVSKLELVAFRNALHGRAFGESVEFARMLYEEFRLRRGSGERFERDLAAPMLARAIAIFDRELGQNHPDLLDLLISQFRGGAVGVSEAERANAGRRLLGLYEDRPLNAATAEAAAGIASELAKLLGIDSPEALSIARTWFERSTACGARASSLAVTLAHLERSIGDPDRALKALEVDLGWLAPDADDFVPERFRKKLRQLEFLEAFGRDASELRSWLGAARAELAANLLGQLPKRSKLRRVVPLLEPYLAPDDRSLAPRFHDVPLAVMDAVAKVLGRTFLASSMNARPTHKVLLDVCRLHAEVSTFDGTLVDGVDVVSLTTADTEEARAAFATADDICPLARGRIYFWWD